MRLIDADALMKRMEDRINDLITDYGQYDSYVNGFEEGLMAVEDAPTVDAVPVDEHRKLCHEFYMQGKAEGAFEATEHGRWVICSDGYYPYCSECRVEPKSGEMTNYCPNCGAKMDSDETCKFIFPLLNLWQNATNTCDTVHSTLTLVMMWCKWYAARIASIGGRKTSCAFTTSAVKGWLRQ